MHTAKLLVWGNEDGDYFGEGHIEPEAFKAAAHAYDVECLGEDHDCEWDCSATMELDDVSHEWWYQPDPDNDELMRRCEPDHPGAEPFTAWRR
jgi:hypothetical protein